MAGNADIEQMVGKFGFADGSEHRWRVFGAIYGKWLDAISNLQLIERYEQPHGTHAQLFGADVLVSDALFERMQLLK